jgi:hypothetical protein
MRLSWRHAILAAVLALLGAVQTSAQNITTVTATITDANGVPYSGASVGISLNASGTATYTPCVNPSAGCQILQPSSVYTDSTGKFTVNLYANGSILPVSSTYTFTVRISPGVLPPWGTGPQQCTLANQTISGTQQTLTFTGCPNLTMTTSGGAANPAAPGAALQLANASVTGFATTAASGNYLSVDNVATPLQLSVPFSEAIAGPRPHVDVTSPVFGAKGDGSTNDLAAIQAAINAACAGAVAGATPPVYFPRGNYRYQWPQSGTSPVFTVPCVLRFEGEGQSTFGAQFYPNPAVQLQPILGGTPVDVPVFDLGQPSNSGQNNAGTSFTGLTVGGYKKVFEIDSGSGFQFEHSTASTSTLGTLSNGDCPLMLSDTLYDRFIDFTTQVPSGTGYGVCVIDTNAAQTVGAIQMLGSGRASNGCFIYYQANVNMNAGPGTWTIDSMPTESCGADNITFQNPNNVSVPSPSVWNISNSQAYDQPIATSAFISTVLPLTGFGLNHVFAGNAGLGVAIRATPGLLINGFHITCGTGACTSQVVDTNGNLIGNGHFESVDAGIEHVSTANSPATITGLCRSDFNTGLSLWNTPSSRYYAGGGQYSNIGIDSNCGVMQGTGNGYGYTGAWQVPAEGSLAYYFMQTYPPTGLSAANGGAGGSLTAGTYTYNLRSTTSSSCGAFASAPSLTTTPLTITSGTSIVLTWTVPAAGSANSVGYCLQRNPGPFVNGWIFIPGASTTTYTDVGATPTGTGLPYVNKFGTTPVLVMTPTGIQCQNCNQPQVYSIAQQGAKSDGVTDDTIAVQNTINLACAFNSIGSSGTTGATILFPTGATVIQDHGTNLDGSTFAVNPMCRGLIFDAPSQNLYDAQLQYKSTPSVFGTAIQLGTPKEAVPLTIARSGNVVTATFAAMNPPFVVTNGSGGPNTVVVQNITGGTTSFNGTFPLTAETATSASWTQTGANESGTITASSLLTSSPDNALEYDGQAGHFTIKNVTVYCTGTASSALANGLGNYVNHTAAIWDWRSGFVQLNDQRNGEGCQYGFGGIQSQLDHFIRISPERDQVGIYLGPRSDNVYIEKPWDQSSDTGIWQNATAALLIDSTNGASCNPSGYWLNVTTTGPTSGPPALFSGLNMRRPNTGTTLLQNWTENDATSNCEATIGAGVGDVAIGSGGYGTYDINVVAHTTQDFKVKNFIDVDQADHIHLSFIGGYLNSMTGALVNIMPTTCAATDITLEGESSQQTWTPLTNQGCTGTAPVLTWTHQHLNQLLVQQFDGTHGFVGTQLLFNNFVLTGYAQANIVANSGSSSNVASFEWNQAAQNIWRAAVQPDQSLQFWDVAHSSFPQIWLTQGGAPELNAESGAITFNGVASSSASGLQVYSGGATPTRWATLANYLDLAIGSAPANPLTGFYRLFMNSGTGQLGCLTSLGASCAPTGGGTPGGSSFAAQYNNGGSFGGITGITGQVYTFNNGSAPTASSPGLADSVNSPVSTANYGIACDSGTTIVDRVHTLRFQSGASTPSLPLSSTSGCGVGFVTTLIDESAGSLVFSRTSTDTFSVYNGSSAATAQTTFTLTNGQYATASVAAAGVWEIRITASSAGSGASGSYTFLSKTANYTTLAADFSSATAAPSLVDYTVSTSTTVTHTLPSSLTGIGTGAHQIVKNDCASTFGLYIAPNTLTVDGATTSFFLEPCDQVEITSNGTNFISSLQQTPAPGGVPFPYNTLNGGVGAGFPFTTTANTPFVTKFVLVQPQKLSKFLVSIQTGVASCVVDFALGDVGRNIITHITSGQVCTGANNFNDSVSTPLVLAPGVYYLGGCTNVTATLSLGAYVLGGGPAQFQQSAEAGSQGTASTACTAGVFTGTTFGTITNSNSPGYFPTVWAN